MKKIIVLILSLVLVLSMAVVAFADDTGSSLVTTSDGKSYEGLPDFPTFVDMFVGETWGEFITDYVLAYNSETQVYYLYGISEHEYVYLYGSRLSAYGESNIYMSPTDLTIYQEGVSSTVFRYSCPVGGTEWTYESQIGDFLTLVDTIIQSSVTIYTDSSCTEVFTQSTTEPLISGLSSTTVVKMMTTEVVGLVPLVIGLAISALALRKGLIMLSQVLARA